MACGGELSEFATEFLAVAMRQAFRGAAIAFDL